MLVSRLTNRKTCCKIHAAARFNAGRSRCQRVKGRQNSLDSEVNCNAMLCNTVINYQFLKYIEIYVETIHDSRKILQKISRS